MHFSSNHYDEFSDMYSVAHVEEKILEKGDFRGEVRITKSSHVMLNDFKISRKVLQTGTGIQGYITFAIWEPNTNFTWKNHIMSKGMIGVLWRKEHQSVTGSGFSGLPISVDENYFIKRCHSKGCPDLIKKLKTNEVLYVEESELEVLRTMILWVNAHTDLPDDILFNLLENQLVELLIDCLLSNPVKKGPEDSTHRKFSKLVDYIHHDIGNITSISQICENTNISERTVRRLIRKKYDISPKKYINALRLNEVRKVLKTNSENSNIVKIASEFNYWHMGQFSLDYKNLFGELPSQTLINSR